MLLAAHVWTGRGDGQHWSDPLNWNAAAPSPGESNVSLDFPADSNSLTLDNDVNGLTLQSVTFGGQYTVTGTSVNLAGSIEPGGLAVVWAAPITLTSDAVFGGGTTQSSSPADFVVSGAIGGTGNVTIAAGSSVTFASGDNNTYSGTTTVDGTLNLASTAPGTFVQVGLTFQPGGAAVPNNLTIDDGGAVNTLTESNQLAIEGFVTVNAGGALTMGATTEIIRGLVGDGTLAGDGTLVLIGGGGFTGPIQGSVSIMVGAGGTLDLNGGVGLTTGTIAQISGDVVLENAQLPDAQLSDTFDYGGFSMALFRGWVGRVNGGGTIGSLLAQNEYVQPGGVGFSPLTVLGNVTLGSGSTFQFDTHEGVTQTIVAGGAVALDAGTFSLTDSFGAGDSRPPRGTAYTLVDNRGSQPVVGTFNHLPNGSLILSGSNQWRLNYNGGDGNDVVLTYLGRDTSVTLSTDANPAVFGHPALHAAVSVNVGTPDVPLTGTVTFFSDGMPIGSGLLDQNGIATLSAVTLPVGLHSITAVYSGDADEYQTSSSPGTLSLRVTPSTPAVTITAPSSAAVGASGNIMVAVQQTDAPGVMPDGQVTLNVDGAPLASATLNASGDAIFSTQTIPAGAHQLSAAYAGDTNFAAAATAAPVMISVVPQISATSGVATVPSSGTGNLVFTVTLSAASPEPVTVSYSTRDASAKAGLDYVAQAGLLTFAPGQTSQVVSVPTTGRAVWQADLTLSLVLSSPAGAALAVGVATGTLQSVDGVPAPGLTHDELNPGQTDLVVDGTSGNDLILVRPTKVTGQVQVVVNNVAVATDGGVSRVIVYGGAGNDRITTDPKLATAVVFFGGDGNDTLSGGAAKDILVGGNGTDTLVGETGMNLLIGGDGADRLKGSRLGDVLVGGATPYDSGRRSDLLKLESLLGVWTDGAPYAARISQISSAMPGGWNLSGALTTDSSVRDSFTTTSTRDWIVRTLAAQARVGHAARRPRGG